MGKTDRHMSDETDKLIDKYYESVKDELETIAEKFKFYRIIYPLSGLLPMFIILGSLLVDAFLLKSSEFVLGGIIFSGKGVLGVMIGFIVLFVLVPMAMIAERRSRKDALAYDKVYFEGVAVPVIHEKYGVAVQTIQYSKAESKKYFSEAGYKNILYKIKAAANQKVFSAYIIERVHIGGSGMSSPRVYRLVYMESDNPKTKIDVNAIGSYGSGYLAAFFPLKKGKYKVKALCSDIDKVLSDKDK